MPPLAKICGITTPDTLDAAVAHGASHVGFVVHPASPRHLVPDRLAALARRLPAHVGAVAVLVDPDDALLDRIAGHVAAIQLHSTAPARLAAIRRSLRAELWAAIPVRTRADLDAVRSHVGLADRILYDAKAPAGSAIPGGLGLRFDWTLLAGQPQPLPWALSGGLDADNVAEAIATTAAPMVDVSSGVESAPGVKDVDKIARFLVSAGRS